MELYTYRFALDPTKDQRILLSKHCGATRFLYNHFLNQRKTTYSTSKQSLNYYDQSRQLPALKKEYNWLKEINSQSAQYALKCVDISFTRFFNKQSKYPKFHSKFQKNSFRIPQFISVEKNKIFFPKFREGIKLVAHRGIEGQIEFATVSKAPTGKYHISYIVRTLRSLVLDQSPHLYSEHKIFITQI